MRSVACPSLSRSATGATPRQSRYRHRAPAVCRNQDHLGRQRYKRIVLRAAGWSDAKPGDSLHNIAVLSQDFLASVGVCFLLSALSQRADVCDSSTCDHILLGATGVSFGTTLWRLGSLQPQHDGSGGGGGAELATLWGSGGRHGSSGSTWDAGMSEAEVRDLRISLLQKEATIMYLRMLLSQRRHEEED